MHMQTHWLCTVLENCYKKTLLYSVVKKVKEVISFTMPLNVTCEFVSLIYILLHHMKHFVVNFSRFLPN